MGRSCGNRHRLLAHGIHSRQGRVRLSAVPRVPRRFRFGERSRCGAKPALQRLFDGSLVLVLMEMEHEMHKYKFIVATWICVSFPKRMSIWACMGDVIDVDGNVAHCG